MGTDQDAPENGGNAEPDTLPADPIDFAPTIERLRTRADRARKTGRANKIQSTAVAVVAIVALLVIVVGGENVVRRWLVPDVSDIAAAKLETANKTLKAATEDSFAKNAAIIPAKANVDAIREEISAAQRAIVDFKEADDKRTVAFAANERALALKSTTEAKYEGIKKYLIAAQARSDDELKRR